MCYHGIVDCDTLDCHGNNSMTGMSIKLFLPCSYNILCMLLTNFCDYDLPYTIYGQNILR